MAGVTDLVGRCQLLGKDAQAPLGQCAAEMVAAQLFNRAEGRDPSPMHGCVTTGEVWQFLRLADSTAWIDPRRYDLDDVDAILAVIQAISSPGDGAA